MNIKRIVLTAMAAAASVGIVAPAAASAQVMPHHNQVVLTVHEPVLLGAHDQAIFRAHGQVLLGAHDQAMDAVPDSADIGAHDPVLVAGPAISTPNRDTWMAVLDGVVAMLVAGGFGVVVVRRRTPATARTPNHC